jgi:hypothetical protein
VNCLVTETSFNSRELEEFTNRYIFH